MVGVSVLIEGLDHPEGVTVDSRGVLYAGGEAGQVYRIDFDGDHGHLLGESVSVTEVANTGGFVLGLCADGQDRLYCCDIARNEVVRVDGSGRVSTYSTGAPGRPFVNPNWPVFDASGRLYVTSSGGWQASDGCVMVVEPGGATRVWTEATAGFPNGACLTPDGEALLVLESTTPALVRVPVGADGRAGKRQVVAELPGTVPDGVCLDEHGTAYVLCYRPDQILTVSPSGEVGVLAEDPLGTTLAAPTNAVWVGPDRRTLVTGNLGRWHLSALRPGPAGIPLHHPLVP